MARRDKRKKKQFAADLQLPPLRCHLPPPPPQLRVTIQSSLWEKQTHSAKLASTVQCHGLNRGRDKLKLPGKSGLKIAEWLNKYKDLVQNFSILFATEQNPDSRERKGITLHTWARALQQQ